MQAHFDHVAGLAEIQRLTGAKMYATEPDAPVLEDGGKSDPFLGEQYRFAPIRVDRRLKDGDTITLGGTELHAHLTPGHTKGSVTYSMRIQDGSKTYNALIANMGTVVMPLLGNSKYPDIADDFARSFRVQKALSADIWVAAHASQYRMEEKLKAGSFVDPGGYRQAVDQHEKSYLEQLARERKRSIKVHGHRGARTVLPENTLPGFEYAIAHGADWIELDLWATKDDVLVVAHDPAMNLKHCSGPKDGDRVIRRMTLAELKQWDCGTPANPDYPRQKAVPGTHVPTFDELLALASTGKFGFNVEIKSYPDRPELAPEPVKYARMVVEAIRKRKLEKRVMIQSFDWRLLHATERLAPELPRSALFPVAGQDKDRDFVEIARDANVKMVSVQYDTVTPEKVKAAHRAGMKVIAWTANSPDVWDSLIAARIDEIITDDPAALVAYLTEPRR
jgi:glycerophosphoryl diester phosphodiesterase